MRRGWRLVVVAAGSLASSLVVFAPTAWAQPSQGDGLGNTIDQLNRMINPDSSRPDSSRNDPLSGERDRSGRSGQYSRDRGYEGSSGPYDRRAGDVRGYSNEALRDEYDRLDDEQRRIQRESRILEDEMQRRGLRR